MFFKLINEMEFSKNQLWRHHYYVTNSVTKLTPQDFSILGPAQSKFLAPPAVIRQYD